MTKPANRKLGQVLIPRNPVARATCTIYVRVPVSLRNSLVIEANENGRTIASQMEIVLRDRYEREGT